MRKILVVIDMQNDFITGSLGTKEAVGIVDHVVNKMKQYPKEDIYLTQDTHGSDYLQTYEGKHLPVVHCLKGSDGWKVSSALDGLYDPSHIILKDTFGSVDLGKAMQQISMDEDIEIEVVGICTDICVTSNSIIMRSFMPNVPISIDSSCCAGVTVQRHEEALDILRACLFEVK